MATKRPLSPLNDFTRHVFLEQANDTTGVTEPVTTGTVTGFLANDNSPAATAFDPAWSVTGTYIGGANGFADGTWQFAIDAAEITLARCQSAGFGAASKPYFIVQKDNAFRVVEPLKYVASRPATIG